MHFLVRFSNCYILHIPFSISSSEEANANAGYIRLREVIKTIRNGSASNQLTDGERGGGECNGGENLLMCDLGDADTLYTP
jgi:hypothetical protein